MDRRITLHSRSKPGEKTYNMVLTPEGYYVHDGLGCEHEQFGGPIACWHSKEFSEPMEDETALAVREERAVDMYYGFTPKQVQVVKNVVLQGKGTDEELALFLATAQRLGLDPFAKEIHGVFRGVNVAPRGQQKRYEDRMSIQVGIDGYRRLAAASGLYGGQEGPFFSEDGEHWTEVPKTKKPKFAKVVIHRTDAPVPITSIVRWDAYNQNNQMWDDRGPEQLAKCAEALGLRRAYPRELGRLPQVVIGSDEEASLAGIPDKMDNVPLLDEADIHEEADWQDVDDVPEEDVDAATGTADDQRWAEYTPDRLMAALLDARASLAAYSYKVLFEELRAAAPDVFAKKGTVDFSKVPPEGRLGLLRLITGEPEPEATSEESSEVEVTESEDDDNIVLPSQSPAPECDHQFAASPEPGANGELLMACKVCGILLTEDEIERFYSGPAVSQ